MKFAQLMDILLPRFITEEVALADTGDQLEIVCSMADLKDGERFDAVATVRSLNLFGQALFPKLIGEPRPWEGTNGHDANQLLALFDAVTDICNDGQTAYVTLTIDPARPYGAVVVDEHFNLLASGIGKSIDGLAELIRLRLPTVGRGEAENTGGMRDDT